MIINNMSMVLYYAYSGCRPIHNIKNNNMLTNKQKYKLTKQEISRLRKPLFERIYNRLTYDPRRRAHSAAREIDQLIAQYGAEDPSVIKRVDELLALAMDRCNDPWDAISTLSLWCVDYDLDLYPNKMTQFDLFHIRYGSLILRHGGLTTPAGRKEWQQLGQRFSPRVN
jgi:hypothetical protein